MDAYDGVYVKEVVMVVCVSAIVVVGIVYALPNLPTYLP